MSICHYIHTVVTKLWSLDKYLERRMDEYTFHTVETTLWRVDKQKEKNGGVYTL